MKMLRGSFLIGSTLLALGIGLTTPAQARVQAVLSAELRCEAEGLPTERVGAELRFDGTSGVFSGSGIRLSQSFSAAGDPLAACEAVATELVEKAQGLGCTTGEVRSVGSPYAVYASVNLVCQGSRTQVLGALGALSSAFVAPDP